MLSPFAISSHFLAFPILRILAAHPFRSPPKISPRPILLNKLYNITIPNNVQTDSKTIPTDPTYEAQNDSPTLKTQPESRKPKMVPAPVTLHSHVSDDPNGKRELLFSSLDVPIIVQFQQPW
uniref:Uncharacterized protein n=1 Tax=Solanum lycopersicum TaxID=4081 RepID=A0A3Q7IX06_SOLLC